MSPFIPACNSSSPAFFMTYFAYRDSLVAQMVESACNVGNTASIPGSGRHPGEGNGNPLQYSCLENPVDRGAWQATVHGVAKSRTRLMNFTLSKQDFLIEMVRVDILTLFTMLWKHFQLFNIKYDVSFRFCTNILYR